MRVRLTRRALGDLGRIGDYLLVRNPAASLRVRDAIEDGLRLIETHPQAGRMQSFGTRRLTLPRFPYLIFYRIDRDEIVVLTIRHGARKPIF